MSQLGVPVEAEPATPLVSVVVPVHNHTVQLATCLDALERQTYPGDRYEVIVVDNASTEDIAATVQSHSHVALVSQPRTGSYAARNTGIEASKGTVLAFTDVDCVPAHDWLERGVARLLSEPTCGLVGGRIDIVPRDPGRPTAVELYDSVMYLRQQVYVREMSFAATANLFTRRAVLDDVGPFDPELPSAGDVDWGRRVAAAGYGLVYADDCRVTHPARRTLSELAEKATRVGRGMGARSRRAPAGQSPRARISRRLRSLALLLPPVRASRRNHAAAAASGHGKTVRVILVTVLDHYLRLWARIASRLSARRSTGGGRAAG
jgi:GT2 family glycosyltransferase